MTNSPPSHSAAAGLFSGLRTVSLLTLASRVLGLIRDMGMAALFGNGVVLDAFTVAFRIPNTARRLFGEGALTAAFLPMFVRELEGNSRQSAWKLASAVFTLLGVTLTALVLLAEAGLWFACFVWDLGPDTHLLIGLTAVLLPYVILICLAAQMSAVLHGLGHFTIPALLPVLLNAIWIAVLFVMPSQRWSQQSQAYVVAASITAAGVAQLVVTVPTLRRLGFHFQLKWPETRDKVTRLAISVLPVLIGLSVTQLNTLGDGLIAWGFSRSEQGPAHMSLPGSPLFPLEAGAASALYFGQRLYQFPLGVFGVALGTVLFPMLSRHAGRRDFDRLRDDLSLGLKLVIIVGLPASLGLVLLAHPLATLLFEHGSFDAQDAFQTSEAIAAYGIGVWAYCGLLIVSRGFYAVGNRQTPLRIALWIVGLNLALNFAFIWPLGGKGLALSTAVCAMLQVVVSVWLVQEHVGRFDWAVIRRFLARAGAATGIMAVACFLALSLIRNGDSLTHRLVSVLVPLVVSIAVYLASAKFLELHELWLLFRRDTSAGPANPPDAEDFS